MEDLRTLFWIETTYPLAGLAPDADGHFRLPGRYASEGAGRAALAVLRERLRRKKPRYHSWLNWS
jgi:hypothetical protein